MNRRPSPISLILALALSLAAVTPNLHAQFALGTGFTYQGQLKSAGSPANGQFDFEFKLFDDSLAGDQQGPTVTADELAVSDGLFSTLLDFGAQFNGEKRWLEIGVRPGTDSGSNPYTLLTPRVELTAAPNSIYALNAGHADTADTATSATNAGALDGLDSLAFLEKDGRAFVIVPTTDDAETNGTNLLAAYNQAKALTPHGAALSADNRAAVLIPPGQYSLDSGQLTLDTQFVDLVGLSSKAEDQYIFGTANGSNTGVIRQTADNVGIENLRIRCTNAAGVLTNSASDPAAYFPEGPKPATVIRNCKFEANGTNAWSMRLSNAYPGRYEFCSGGASAFGGGAGGTANGTFTNCVGGDNSFGKGIASGVFTNCTGGNNSFASPGTASGKFTNCVGGNNTFGSGSGGTASGTFTNCTGGVEAFGGFGVSNGTFYNCTGGDYAFGGSSTVNGLFINCTGGAFAFGGDGFSASGRFFHCNGGASSFTELGSPIQLFCIKNGAVYSGNN